MIMGRYRFPNFMASNVLLTVLLLLLSNSRPCFGKNSTRLCRPEERAALLEFKQHLQLDPTEDFLRSWEGEDCCSWEGLRCDRATGHVTKLELLPPPIVTNYSGWFYDWSMVSDPTRRFHISGLSPSLLTLRYLNHLDLSGVRLRDNTPFPEFIGSMRHLSYLNLSNTGFVGFIPDNVGNLTSLEVLDLRADDQNLYLGHSDWISHLAALKYLDMSWVSAEGTAYHLMQVLNTLPSLSHLALADCGLDAFTVSHGFFNSTFLANLQYLDLSRNYNLFSGSIPSPFQNMTSIRHLDLSHNHLQESSVPIWFSNFRGLSHLNLEFNFFESIEGGFSFFIRDKCQLRFLSLAYNFCHGEISRNSSGFCAFGLESLRLQENSYSGELPDWLGNLNWLVELDLSQNLLQGPIPRWLERKQSLQWLDLSNNCFSGAVPEGLGQLSRLEYLDLSSNSLEGAVSESHFATVSRLKYLDISNNSLTVKVDSNWSPPFQLIYIKMGSCIFGTKFPLWIKLQKDVISLVLSNASISADMPEWLGTELGLGELDLSHNLLSGKIPRFSAGMMWSLDLSHNLISGKIPSFSSGMQSLDLSHNLTSGPVPPNIGEMPVLEILFLNDNHLIGPIPASLCKLQSLYKVDLSGNELSGSIPDCLENTSLSFINFSSNKLHGVIPTSIGHLTGITVLHLNNNSLHGEVPSSLRNNEFLGILDLGENKLSGVLPAWIGVDVQSLLILRLRQNNFTGTLPEQFCSLFRLQLLDLAVNDLQGSIPHCLGSLAGMHQNASSAATTAQFVNNATSWAHERMKEVMKGSELEYSTNLKFMVSLDLSSNNFTGPIPPELTHLTRLHGLNLSHNLLSGNIPYNIGAMKLLESLDFSTNRLSGEIPPSLSNLYQLSRLNLSKNGLTGKIPRSTQLDSLYVFDHSIYSGNPLLCWDPLLNKCPGDGDPNTPITEKLGGEDLSDKVAFYGVIVLGFASGFWGAIGILVVKKSWRAAYFELAEETGNKIYVFVLVALKAAKLKRRIIRGERIVH